MEMPGVPRTSADNTKQFYLDLRKQAILKAICTEHIARAEPIGSELLASQYPLGVRSATLRNEMAEMTELGYLRQPHTSAGRVPSDRGYRFYVDRLMPMGTLPPRSSAAIQQLRDLLHEEVDAILREACRLVAHLTHYTSIATPPIMNESRLESIRLLLLDSRRLLVVLVLESGRVEHRMADLEDGDIKSGDLERLQPALDRLFAGRKCGELNTRPDLSENPPRLRRLLERIEVAVREGLQPRAQKEVVVEGEANVLREPEFHDLERLDRLMELLHSRQSISDMIALADRDVGLGKSRDSSVAVIIGSEAGYEQAREYSFVAARYQIAGQYAGAIGVFGPTRMRYSQTVPVVETVARQVSELLTDLSGA